MRDVQPRTYQSCVPPACRPFPALQQLAQVGGKRSRADFEGDVEIQPVKKVRTGNGARQWITVYNKHQPMKQRWAGVGTWGRVAVPWDRCGACRVGGGSS